MEKRRFAILLIFIAVYLCSGCEEKREYFYPEKISANRINTVAIIPFESLSGHPNAGIIMSRLFQTEIEKIKAIQTIPRPDITAALAEKEGEAMQTEELGKLLSAKTIITGSVTEYGYKRGVGEKPVLGIVVKLIDVASGEVLWSYSFADTGSYSIFSEDSLSVLASKTARKMAKSFKKGLKKDG